MSDIGEIERDLAYSAARSDIECCCVQELVNGRHAGRWYLSTEVTFSDDIEVVERAIRYLDYRGLLHRHPDNKLLIRPLDADHA